jgi:hypothetical protein
LRRARASNLHVGKIVGTITWFYGSVLWEGVHPLESGFIRLKYRRDRRPGFPVEAAWRFYPKYISNLVSKIWCLARLYYTYHPLRKKLDAIPSPMDYMDTALQPVDTGELSELQMFQVTDAARVAADRAKRRALDHAH